LFLFHSFDSTSNFFQFIKKLGVENQTQKKHSTKVNTNEKSTPQGRKPRGKIYDLVCDEQTEQ